MLVGDQFNPAACGFFKNVFSKEQLKPCISVTFNIIISHIFPEHFIEISQFIHKIWRFFWPILNSFINFHQFFGLFDISLLQRN